MRDLHGVILRAVLLLMGADAACGASDSAGQPVTPAPLRLTAEAVSVGSWTHLDLRVGAIYCVVVDPANTDVVYAGTYEYPWKSTDAGLSWTETSNGLPIDSGIGWSIVVDPVNTSTVYLAIGAIDLYGDGGVYRSTDAGASWAEANTGLRITNTWSLAMDPADPAVLYAGSWGIHKSTNGGASWTEVLPDYVAKTIVTDSSGVIYAGMLFGLGIQKSDDGGATWTPINTGLPPAATIWSLAVAPTDPSTLYAGTENFGVYKSVNAGASWSSVNVGMEAADAKRIWALAVDPDRPSIVYAGTVGGGLFRSADGGMTWENRQSGTIVTSFAVNPQDRTDIVASLAGTGLARSADGGQTWEHLFGDAYITDMFCMAMDPTDANTLFAGSSAGEGIYTSTDGGWGWTTANAGLTLAPFANVWTIVIDPNDRLTMYTAGDNDSGVFKSTDGGAGWSAISNGLTDKGIYALTLDPTDSNMLYAGTDNGTVFRSADAGANWSATGGGIPLSAVKSIVIDPTNPNTIYAGTLGAGLYKTTDGAATWVPKNNGLTNVFVSSVVIDAATPSVVYAGTGVFDPSDAIPNNGNGVYVSRDAGETWSEMGQGLTGRKVFALTMTTGPTRGLLAGTTGEGIFFHACGPGDFDCDGDVDLIDFATWPGCMTGPEAGPVPAGCEAVDFDMDDDVDLPDFAAFQAVTLPTR